MRIPPLVPMALLLVLTAACDRHDANRPPAGGAATETQAPVPASNDAAVTMRYSCDGRTSVEVFGADGARATLPDGRIIELRKIADSMPPVFAGGSLYFAIGSTDAHLSQEDATNELACTPQ